MNWKPSNWEKIRLQTRPEMSSRELFAFDDGADAILKAIIEERGTPVELVANCDIPMVCSLSTSVKMVEGAGLFQKGWLVFIPVLTAQD